jgi:small-conductance mechanosensitive channel
MILPIDFNRFQEAFASSRGQLEFALTAVCLLVAWAIDRRIERAHALHGEAAHMPGSVLRLAFPLVGLALTFVASSLWRHHVGPPFFLAIAIPLLVALGAIRMLVYMLRRLFPAQRWLPASELAIGSAIWGLAALYFVGILPEIASALDELVIPIGSARVSILSILEGVIIVVVTLVVTLWISGLVEQRLARTTQLDANLRVVLSNSIRALLIVVGMLIALEQIGFDLTLLTVFGGALGVGIGLGLQKFASNYIAGFTILLDRSMRIGDLVTVDGRTGIVSKVTSRYVVVKSLDGLEAIVPNETVVTTTVLNHSYSSPQVRVAIQVQIAYDNDVNAALAVMTDIAKREPRVLGGDRAPAAYVASLGENGILLELGVWIVDPQLGHLALRSALNRAILAEFGARAIKFPVPQRELRIVDGKLPVPTAPA